MKKIISLFQRNYDGDRLVRNEVTPGAEWVINGEGMATVKWDGTCVMIRHGEMYKRYDAKAFTIGQDGQKQTWNRKPPEGFEPAQNPDPITGHWPGWLPVGNEPESKYHREALAGSLRSLEDGTYELCGPKLQGNPEGLTSHMLLPHGKAVIPDCPRDFEGIKAYLGTQDMEGIVWHHPDGRMVKIKAKDFGIKRQAINQ